MARNYIQPGVVADYTNATGSTITTGTVLVIGSRIGVALVDIPDTEAGAVQVQEVFELAKKSADVIGQGVPVYWDDTAKEITLTSTANTLAGYAFAAAGAAVVTVLVHLNG